MFALDGVDQRLEPEEIAVAVFRESATYTERIFDVFFVRRRSSLAGGDQPLEHRAHRRHVIEGGRPDLHRNAPPMDWSESADVFRLRLGRLALLAQFLGNLLPFARQRRTLHGTRPRRR
ncbi:hypothetical protein ELH77_12730 [Rhizobium ruizarguesonis]|nr:hypothetical protein [Rhizobium leguminosarum]TAZ19565.1 hypothetical protein ELH77_12730 [Rhizobium ruizarguesonis]TBC94744.1 hypothetical protein ELH26_12225 [Rhizobium leguminosarum]